MTDTHCHNLVLGYDGRIHGEDIGGAGRTGDHLAVWTIEPGQRPAFVQPLAGEPDPSIWIVRDAAGNGYAWDGNPDARRHSRILKRAPDRRVAILAGSEWGAFDGRGEAARFGHVGAMASAADGTLYVLDDGSLRRVSVDGTVETVARGAFDTRPGGLPNRAGLWNHSLGLAVASDGSVYVVERYAHRWVKWTPKGGVTVLLEAGGLANALTHRSWGWTPSGVAIGLDGVYVMDGWSMPSVLSNLVGTPRIRRIAPDGRIESIASVSSPQLRVGTAVLLLLSIIAVVSWRRSKRRRTTP